MSVLADFHPAVRRWFEGNLGDPTPPQTQGWPKIRQGSHTLIAAPTGTGKTLAAFLCAIDSLLKTGPYLPEETRVLYVSPLKALSNDIRKNLETPLEEIGRLDPFLPEIRVTVRTGDTPSADRQKMVRKPPHILVTTPESLYILLTSRGGRNMLSTVRTVIVDEIHSLARDKRGSHLALSLERLETLAGPVQRIGLSATQKPIEEIADFLVGTGRECSVVDAGHLRKIDVGLEVPSSPLTAVCSNETWEEIYARITELIREHRTTLVFVNTRKMAERIAAKLTGILGEEEVTCHHGSLSKTRRLDAERRLKEGKLRALVATASLELGIDIGDVDLAIQVGSSRSIATFLQRVGRAGHVYRKIPKGRIFPLTIDELVESAALLRAVKHGELDRIHLPEKPLDILAQQIVAACVAHPWGERELFDTVRRARPYRDLTREEFDSVVSLHTQGRYALLHRDGVNEKIMATRRARITAITCGGAIPDTADYKVVVEPEETYVGSVNEDFAIESNAGDIFQLGNASWRILRVESRQGVVRVADAKGMPPTIPFWFGEAPARTEELSARVAELRDADWDLDALMTECGIGEAAARQILEYLSEGKRVLGAVPTQKRLILERFFDESGGMQLILHAPFGGRINRALGLALRKRFCRGFGFELQAAANEDAILMSLGPQHSFALAEVFDYLHPNSARHVLIQAMLPAPMFETRWRWNVTRSLLVERMRGGKRIPAPLVRMRADDQLAAAFPQAAACPETLPGGDVEIPMDHPVVRQTVEDCLHEGMDVDGFLRVLEELRGGSIERIAVDTPEPSVFAQSILNARPYSFLDDAPLEERRTMAVQNRRTLDPKTVDEFGALDPEAVARVREEAWPRPESMEEVHEALLWMGYATEEEGKLWEPWLRTLQAAGRVDFEEGKWFAVESSRDPKEMLRGRLEALGPVFSDDPLLLELEREGKVLRTRLEGRQAWCDRRLLARIHRYTLERLRAEIEPVSAAQFWRYLGAWQNVTEERRLDGPRGVAEAVRKLAGFEIPAPVWEKQVLAARVRGYQREWLDQLMLSGEVVWGRLWGSSQGSIRSTPVCLLLREDLESWLGLAQAPCEPELSGRARELLRVLRKRGAVFTQELVRGANLLPSHLEMGLEELVTRGMLTCDAFSPLRWLLAPSARRRPAAQLLGRWSLFREKGSGLQLSGFTERKVESGDLTPSLAEFVARQLLRRYGVVFRRLLEREKIPVPWRDLVRVFRNLELKGEVRGGRFVSHFLGEQYALPEAVTLLRQVRRNAAAGPVEIGAADPLNLHGILTPEERISSRARRSITVG